MPSNQNLPGGPLFEPVGAIGPPGAPKELARVETRPPAEIPRPESDVGTFIRLSLEKGIDPKEAYAIFREERATLAKATFIAAKAKFKKECPPVPKSQVNPQFSATEGGVKRPSMFAPLEAMQTIADPHLEANGFSYDWKEPMPGPNGERYLEFLLCHVGGWSEAYPARITTPEKGGCSEPQKDGIAYEYARRQSFRNGTGIRVVGEDNDGNDPPHVSDKLPAEKRDTLKELCQQSGVSTTKLCAMYGVESGDLIEFPARMYGPACTMLNQKIKSQKAGKT